MKQSFFFKIKTNFKVGGKLFGVPMSEEGEVSLDLGDVTMYMMFDINDLANITTPNLDSLAFDIDFQHATLKGSVNGLRQKLRMNVTDLLSKVTFLMLQFFDRELCQEVLGSLTILLFLP